METTQPEKGGKLTVCYIDKDKNKSPWTYENIATEELERLNKEGRGIFKTTNSFFATPEQLRELAAKKGKPSITKRNKEFLSKINAVAGDLDVCKEGDGMPPEEKKKRKAALMASLMKCDCPPSAIIVTKNGLQPRWDVNEPNIDEPTQQKYVNIVNGIIEWSKQNGALGDHVKDVTHIFRVPGYLHLKSDPYLVTEEPGSGRTYTLDELKVCFWHEGKPYKPLDLASPFEKNPAFNWVDELDIRQVAIDVWQDLGHSVSINKNNQLSCAGRSCGCSPNQPWATFVNRDGKNFISNGGSSIYPAEGNAITYTAETLKITPSEAYKRLMVKYSANTGLSIQASLKEEYEVDSQVGGYNVAKYLVKSYHVITFGEKIREIYIYQDGIYVSGESFLRGEIQTLLQELASRNAKNEIIDKIQDLTVTKRDITAIAPELINLQNGVFNIKTGELLPHDPKYRFFSKIPVDYRPDALCPQIDIFFKEILNEKDIPVMEEWFGYALYRSYFIKKAMILVGEKNTGKTTTLKVLNKFIGRSNISGVSLQRLTTDRFSAANLYNKHVNIYDDLSVKDIQDNGMFKIATGTGIITGEVKFRDQFQFMSHAKLIFACNQIPSVKDTEDEAYFSRWIVLEFNKEILNQDKFLIDKMTTPEELSGLLNTALRGLQRLLNKQEFSYESEPDAIKTQMLRSGSSIAKFVYDCLRPADSSSWVSKEDMYEYYGIYARKAGLPIETMNKFGRRLQKFAPYITEGRPKSQDTKKQDTAWMGVEIVNEANDTETSSPEIIPASQNPTEATVNQLKA